MHEAGFRPLPAVVRTSAPRERRPLLREWLARDQLSAISDITPARALYLSIQERALKGPGFATLEQQLLDHLPEWLAVV